MPELPEVETTLRGIKSFLEKQIIKKVIIRHYGLRWPIARDLPARLYHQKINKIERRGKYLLFKMNQGTLIIHLGMSGSLRLMTKPSLPKKHDHLDFVFGNHMLLRLNDPRRFGAVLWTENPEQHFLLANLGPEPLTRLFSANYLWPLLKNKKAAIKTLIMNNKIVVGVGNIYATEALFLARIDPRREGNSLSFLEAARLIKAIKLILRAAIQEGGTTLKDFVNSQGKPGYFTYQLKVYGRESLPCVNCNSLLLSIQINQRTTVYCEHCQS